MLGIGCCSSTSQDVTPAQVYTAMRPQQMKKLLKPKTLKKNTSYTALEVADHSAQSFQYLVQTQPAASTDLNYEAFDLEEYHNEHLAFEI